MDDIKIRAYAKVNLSLDVLGRREDGYHELSTVMSSIDVFDELTLSLGHERASVEAEPPLPENSVAFRSLEAYAKKAGLGDKAGANVKIVRNIPSEAGLGSSSVDAAGMLAAMQTRFNALNEDELFELAASLGADVPFCLRGGMALCRGKGELIEPLPMLDMALLIVMPRQGVATAELFSRLEPPYKAGLSQYAAEAIRAGDFAAFLPCVGNALTETAIGMSPEIASLLFRLGRAGALAAGMTGSGSAVFGVYAQRRQALNALTEFSDMPFARVTMPVSRAWDVV